MQHAVLTFVAYHSDLFEEAERVRRTFERFDRDSNSLISREEFALGIKKGGVFMSDEEINQLFDTVDKDGSGHISYTEFTAGSLNLDIVIKHHGLEQAFAFFDQDHSGRIDRTEMLQALRLGWISEKHVGEIIQAYDSDKDQQVSSRVWIRVDIVARVQEDDERNRTPQRANPHF
jgi:Ca2+-binding EF-hand superfamily protein